MQIYLDEVKEVWVFLKMLKQVERPLEILTVLAVGFTHDVQTRLVHSSN